MAVTQSSRLGLTLWGAGSDPLTRAQLLTDHQRLDLLAALDVQGATVGDRPAAGIRGRYYTALDTGLLYRDTGTDWVQVGSALATTGSGALTFGGSGASGASTVVAREDHTHGMPAHDGADHSAIELSDLAAPSTALSMGSQRIENLLDPVNAQDATSKTYVDGLAVPPGWTGLTLTSGTDYGLANGYAPAISIRKFQGVATLRGVWQSPAGVPTLCTVPEEYRPTRKMMLLSVPFSNHATSVLATADVPQTGAIWPSGVLKWNTPSAAYLFFHPYTCSWLIA